MRPVPSLPLAVNPVMNPTVMGTSTTSCSVTSPTVVANRTTSIRDYRTGGCRGPGGDSRRERVKSNYLDVYPIPKTLLIDAYLPVTLVVSWFLRGAEAHRHFCTLPCRGFRNKNPDGAAHQIAIDVPESISSSPIACSRVANTPGLGKGPADFYPGVVWDCHICLKYGAKGTPRNIHCWDRRHRSESRFCYRLSSYRAALRGVAERRGCSLPRKTATGRGGGAAACPVCQREYCRG